MKMVDDNIGKPNAFLEMDPTICEITSTAAMLLLYAPLLVS